MKRRIVYRDIINHCYQRSADGGVLFYTQSDHLVFFTLYCTLARKYDVRVLSLCQMPDHIHDAVVVKSLQQLSGFKKELNARFAKSYNAFCKTTGPVFEKSFGSAPKMSAKKGRTNLIYIANNPVERQLVTKAEDYRWNYLLYGITSHPFSDEIIIRRASKPMRSAVRMVKAQFEKGIPMNYTLIKNLTEKLTATEQRQFTDLVISTYNVIDYGEALRYFDSYEDMLTAFHATTGSEYDLNEIFIGKSDKPYSEMTRILMIECGFRDIHEFLSWDDSAKWELFRLLRVRTRVMNEQIGRYLHLAL